MTKIQFGSKVSIINLPFYKNTTGTVVKYSQADKQYTVQLEHGIYKDFFGQDLKVVSKSKRGRK